MAYEPIIGLEVHAQLLTESKIFCGCRTGFGAQPNTQTCPVCLGMPGVLPVVNRQAVAYGVKMALAVHCEIHPHSIFARKNYFYPDLPKGYQISQYEEPLAENGWVEIEPEGGGRKKIGIKRIHLEEDAGKLVHDEPYVAEDESLVDFNRCGVPLLEIVSEPDLRSPQEATLCLTKLRKILRWLGICDGNMEEGSLRCDANVSLRTLGEKTFGVKTELKNLNSFRAVERALICEIDRQTELLEDGGEVVQETLLWDGPRERVVPMRGKEEVDDYRYFSDPDLVPLVVEEEWVETIREALPEMPDTRKQRWIEDFGLSEYDASVLSEEKAIADYFEDVAKGVRDPRQASRWVMGEVLRVLKEKRLKVEGLKIGPAQLASVIRMVHEGAISRTAAKVVFDEVADSGADPQEIVEQKGLLQISDIQEIERVVDGVVGEYGEEVQKYLAGRKGVFDFLMGQVMRTTGGRANPEVTKTILKKKLTRMD